MRLFIIWSFFTFAARQSADYRLFKYNRLTGLPQKINFFCSAERRIWHLPILFLYFNWIEELAGGEIGFEAFVPTPGICDFRNQQLFFNKFLLHRGGTVYYRPFFL